MWWKIYFWISAIIAGWNVLGLFEEILEGQVSRILPILATWVYALAVYSYAYKKHIFSQQSWKRWLVIVLLTQVLRWAPLAFEDTISEPFALTMLFLGSLILLLPAWYCIYKLGFGKKEM